MTRDASNMDDTADLGGTPGGSGTSAVERLKEIIAILNKHNVIQGMSPQKLCAVIEDLGPTFVKLGQIMSMRPDMIPAAYCTELQKLRANVTPMPMDEVRRVIEQSLGMPLKRAFPVFDETPLGSASIAQAHRATLADGTRVVVKVQREGIHEKMASDIRLLRKAAALLKLTPTGGTIDFGMVLDEMWVVSQEEMNFAVEAKNLEEFKRLNADIAYVSCPVLYRELSTRRVLVMDEICGVRIDETDKLRKQGYDPDEITRKLCANYMKQILADGFFHADPHPGNLLIANGKIVWIDLGMVGRLTQRDQGMFKKMLNAAIARDTGGMAEGILQLGKHEKPIDRETLYADVDNLMTEYLDTDIATINLNEFLQQVMDLAKKHHISMPPGVTMLARGVGTLEGLAAAVSPRLSVISILSEWLASDSLHNIDWKKAFLRDGHALYESAQKSLSIPALMSDTLRAMQKGEFKLRMEEQRSTESEKARDRRMERVRQTALLCAGVLGSSLMTLCGAVEPSIPRVLGVPWIALAGFAATGAFGVLCHFVGSRNRR